MLIGSTGSSFSYPIPYADMLAQDAESEIVSTPPEYEDSDGHLAPCQALRGLWGDLIVSVFFSCAQRVELE